MRHDQPGLAENEALSRLDNPTRKILLQQSKLRSKCSLQNKQDESDTTLIERYLVRQTKAGIVSLSAQKGLSVKLGGGNAESQQHAWGRWDKLQKHVAMKSAMSMFQPSQDLSVDLSSLDEEAAKKPLAKLSPVRNQSSTHSKQQPSRRGKPLDRAATTGEMVDSLQHELSTRSWHGAKHGTKIVMSASSHWKASARKASTIYDIANIGTQREPLIPYTRAMAKAARTTKRAGYGDRPPAGPSGCTFPANMVKRAVMRRRAESGFSSVL